MNANKEPDKLVLKTITNIIALPSSSDSPVKGYSPSPTQKRKNLYEEVMKWFKERDIKKGNPEDIIMEFENSQKTYIKESCTIKKSFERSSLLVRRKNTREIWLKIKSTE